MKVGASPTVAHDGVIARAWSNRHEVRCWTPNALRSDDCASSLYSQELGECLWTGLSDNAGIGLRA